MRLLIVAVGRLKQGPERDLCEHYLGRADTAGRKLALSPVTVIEVPESRGPAAPSRCKAEAAALIAKLPRSYPCISLDPMGEALGSEAFARLLGKLRDGSIEKLAIDTPEPSAFAKGILSSQPYAFLDDAPLEERRTQAVLNRRTLDPRSLDDLGALDPAAVQRVRDEAGRV